MSQLSKGSVRPEPPKDKIRVYSMRFCPYAQRPRLVLAAKGIDYDCVNINLKNKPEWFLAHINPSGTVPAIEMPDGRVLPESIICCEFLEDSYPQNPLYPKDPFERNKQRLLINNFSKLPPLYYKIARGQGDDDTKQNLSKSMGVYEKELADRKTKFFGGEKPGMLDYLIWPWFERLPVIKDTFDVNKDTFPNLYNWMLAMKEDPAIKETSFPLELHKKFMLDYYKGSEESQLYGSDHE